MIKSLHPSLKACACGFVGVKSGLLNHLNDRGDMNFWREHGEIPLNEDGTTGSGRKLIHVELTIEDAVTKGLNES